MDEKMQQRDFQASACVYFVRVCVWTIVMWIITPFAHQWPWVSEKSPQILIFADKAQCQGRRNEFYFRDLSHSTDYVPLHLRWLHSAWLSSRTDNMWRLSPNFYSLTYNAVLYGWQFTPTQSLRWGLLCIYRLDQSGSILYPYFYPVNPKLWNSMAAPQYNLLFW